MPDDKFGLNKIMQIAIGVEDQEVCTAFYRKYIGDCKRSKESVRRDVWETS